MHPHESPATETAFSFDPSFDPEALDGPPPPVPSNGGGSGSDAEHDTEHNLERSTSRWRRSLRRKLRRAKENNERAAANAARDGVRGSDVTEDGLFSEESKKAFDGFLRDMRGDLRPRGRMEEFCVEQMAVAHWRLKRALRDERDFFIRESTVPCRAGVTPPAEIIKETARGVTRALQEARAVERNRLNAERAFMRAMDMLRKLQGERRRRTAKRVDQRYIRAFVIVVGLGVSVWRFIK